MIFYTHRIAGVRLTTESDVQIHHIENDLFKKFQVKNDPDIKIKIQQFDNKSLTLPPLNNYERNRIAKSIDFPKRWLDSPVFRSPAIRTVVQCCLDQPEMVQIELAWNRIIIRNFAHRELNLFYPIEKKKDFSDPIFRAGYRNLIASTLSVFSAVLIHGAGIIRNGKTAIFLAPDEGGKTTTINNSISGTILSDDQIVFRLRDNLITIHGTPFGEIGHGPKYAELGGLFLLEKAPFFEISKINPLDIFQFIWNDNMLKWFPLSKNFRIRAFEILYNACFQVPVYKMQFPKDYVDWDAIDRAMKK